MTTTTSRRHGRTTKSTDLAHFRRINALQIRIPILLLCFLGFIHLAFPAFSPLTNKFVHIQYCQTTRWYTLFSPTRSPELCGKGIDDAYIVFTGILFFTVLRAFMMSYVFEPLARTQGIIKSKAIMRFAEQAWGFSWALSSWSCGMYLFYHSDYWLNMDAFYSTWPEIKLDPLFKLYYLMQLAFWFQCILALNLEAKRKDYVQMFGHHILTSTLLITSYAFNTTRVGHVILTLMDVADIFLPLAKMLKYMGHQTLCDGGFVLFLISWAVSRHYLLVKIIMHAYELQPIKLRSGRNITWFFVTMLAGLEILICLWSLAILRVLYGIITGGNADDSRSDTEYSDSEPDKTKPATTNLPESSINGGLLNSQSDNLQAEKHHPEKKKSK